MSRKNNHNVFSKYTLINPVRPIYLLPFTSRTRKKQEISKNVHESFIDQNTTEAVVQFTTIKTHSNFRRLQTKQLPDILYWRAKLVSLNHQNHPTLRNEHYLTMVIMHSIKYINNSSNRSAKVDLFEEMEACCRTQNC